MKLNRLIVLVAGFATIVSACHKDNGNYDYTTEGGAIIISENMKTNPNDPLKEPFLFKIGDEIVIPALYTVNDPMLKEEQILIEWFYGGELAATGKEFKLPPQGTGRYTGVVTLTDLRYDQKYMSQFGFQVEGTYTEGWAVVSETADKSLLSYLYIDSEGEYVFKEDVYGASNGGAVLPKGIRAVSETMYNTYPQIFALSLVAPGEEGPLQLDCSNMAVLGKTKENFITAPEGIEFKDVAYLYSNVYALTTDNRLFARTEATYETYVVPHASVFPSSPVATGDGCRISQWINTGHISVMMTFFEDLLAYDEANGRCVMIYQNEIIPFSDIFFTGGEMYMPGDSGTDGTNTYDDYKFPNPADMSEYNVKGMWGAGFDTDFMAWSQGISVIMLLERKSDAKKFIFTFRFYDAWGMQDIDLDLFFPVPDDMDIDPDKSVILKEYLGGPNNYFFFTSADRKNLWFFNAVTGAKKVIYKSESPISAIGSGEIQDCYVSYGMSEYNAYYEKLALGKDDGSIDVIGVDATALATGNAPLVKTLTPGVGAPKFITYLTNSPIVF